MKVTLESIETAYAKEQDIYNQASKLVDEIVKQGKCDRFFASNHQAEFKENRGEKKGKRVGDVWSFTTIVNGHIKYPSISVWRDATEYNQQGNCLDDNAIKEILYASEYEKVLYKGKNYRISLLRTEVRKPTKNHWGYRIKDAKYALIDNKNNILILEKEQWKFTALALGNIVPKVATSISDELRKFNQFKTKIVHGSDTETLAKVCDSLGFAVKLPHEMYQMAEKLKQPNTWIVFILGLRTKNTRGYHKTRNATWFVYEGETKPTHEEAFIQVMSNYKFYKGTDIISVLNTLRTQGTNLNTLDLDYEELKTNQYNGDFANHFAEVFDVSFATLHNTILPDAEPIFKRWRMHRDGTKTAMPNEEPNKESVQLITNKIEKDLVVTK